jgi:hypothetical protein
MPPKKKMPPWDPKEKEKSLVLYASWLNQIARAAFLESGHHQQMFHFVTDAGDILSCLIRDGLPLKKRDALLRQEAAKIKPFGTIQVVMKKIYRPKAQDVRLAGDDDSDTREMVRDCLLVRMLSRTGKEIMWVNPIVRKDGRLVLADPVVTYPNDDSTVRKSRQSTV